MLDNEILATRTAAFKRDSRKEFDKAVAALITLAWRYSYLGEDFRWDADPELRAESLRICRELSDTLAERAKEIARKVVTDSLDYFDFEGDWENEDGPEEGESLLTRLDMAGSHLLDLLEVWIALAFIHGLGATELRVEVSRYLANPFLSPLWRGVPKDALKWGRGFMKNIPEQLAIIGQRSILAAARRAEQTDAQAKGAEYYIRRRGSGYDCPECDGLCGYPIPIYEPFEIPHPRCMCYPEYHFEPMPNV